MRKSKLYKGGMPQAAQANAAKSSVPPLPMGPLPAGPAGMPLPKGDAKKKPAKAMPRGDAYCSPENTMGRSPTRESGSRRADPVKKMGKK